MIRTSKPPGPPAWAPRRPGAGSIARDATDILVDFVHRSLMSESGLMNRRGKRGLCGVSIVLVGRRLP